MKIKKLIKKRVDLGTSRSSSRKTRDRYNRKNKSS